MGFLFSLWAFSEFYSLVSTFLLTYSPMSMRWGWCCVPTSISGWDQAVLALPSSTLCLHSFQSHLPYQLIRVELHCNASANLATPSTFSRLPIGMKWDQCCISKSPPILQFLCLPFDCLAQHNCTNEQQIVPGDELFTSFTLFVSILFAPFTLAFILYRTSLMSLGWCCISMPLQTSLELKLSQNRLHKARWFWEINK